MGLVLLGGTFAMGKDAACVAGLLSADACVTGASAAVTASLFDAAQTAAELALKLVGVMTLWLGLMRVAEKAGLIQSVGRLVEPIMCRLFPEIPRGHPALSAITLNLSANALGIGNAATPLGIKAMQELQKLNPSKDTATNAMCLFLALHATSFTPLPSTTMALRKAAGALDPADIVGPVAVATAITSVLSVILCKLMQRFSAAPPPPQNPPAPEATPEGTAP